MSNPIYLSTAFRDLSILSELPADAVKTDKLQEKFLEALKLHDSTYMYSDDHRVYMRGKAESDILERIAAKHENLTAILSAYYKDKGSF